MKLRKWFENLLLIIFSISFIFCGAEHNNIKIFIISKLIAMVLMATSGYLLIKNIDR